MADSSFIRWQGRTIEQMGYAINTLLVSAIATVGFVVNKLLDGKIYCYSRFFMVWGCFLLLIAIFGLILLIINRLTDFRITTKIARKRETNNTKDLDLDRETSKKLGKRTWNLFYFAFAAFSLGEILVIIGVIICIA
jgi:uncharacterized membrane protein